MPNQTPQSRQEALLQNILGASYEVGVPQSRIEKIWQYALGSGVQPDEPQSRLEALAIQVAEAILNGGGGIPTGTINITTNGTYNVRQYANAAVGVYGTEDALVDGSMSGTYVNTRVEAVSPYGFYSQDGLTLIKMPSVIKLGANSFLTYTNSNISYIELPSVQTISATAFRGLNSLAALNLYSPSRTEIPTLANTNAFTNSGIAAGTGYIVINDELVNTLKAAANWSTYASQIVSYSYAVEHDLIVEVEYDEPDVIYHTLEDRLVEKSLTSYTNNRVSTIGQHAMRGFTNLTEAEFAEVTTISTNAFYGNTAIETVKVPKAKTIGREAFYRCSGIAEINLPALESIGVNGFQDCSALATLNLYSPDRTAIPTLAGTGALTGTAIAAGNGYIVINDELVDALKSATNWITYASQIIGHTTAVQQGIVSA